MTCHACGNVIPDIAKFCGKCGAPVSEGVQPVGGGAALNPPAAPIPPVKPQNTFPLSKILIGAGLAAVVIIAVIVCVSLFKPARFTSLKNSINFFPSENGVQVVTTNGTVATIEGILNGSSRSLDGSVAAALINTDSDSSDFTYNYEDGYTLYYIADGKITVVSEEVYDFRLAASGDAIAYSTNLDGDVAELNLYSGGKSQKITSEFYKYFCISPDGKTVAYISDYDESEDEFTGYIWNGKAKSLGKNRVPLAVSNDGKYAYFIKVTDDYEHPFYVLSGDDEIKLGSSAGSMYFNSDATQVVYNVGGGSYISINGSEKLKLVGRVERFILPEWVPISYSLCYGQYNSYIFGVNSFAGTFYNNDDSVVYIDGKFETSSVVKKVQSVMLCDDAKTLIYRKGGSICKTDGTKPDAEPIELVEEDAADFCALSDGSAIYYVSIDDELYYQKGTQKAKRVAYDLDGSDFGYFMDVFNKTGAVYYLSDGQLYVSGKGAKGTLVKGIDDDVINVNADSFFVNVISKNDDYGFNIYLSTDGIKFELIAES